MRNSYDAGKQRSVLCVHIYNDYDNLAHSDIVNNDYDNNDYDNLTYTTHILGNMPFHQKS